MPNWAEGSLKLRGKKENIAQALKYMFCTADNVEIEEDLEIGWFKLTTTAPYFYINGTRRAFIKNDKLDFWLDDDYLVIEINDFNQAWAAVPDNYKEISSKFDVDIKIFTFECGMEFTQEIEISKGEITKDICYEYDEYQWEVPFSNLGG